MNIWLARLGGDENLPIDKFQTLLRKEFRFSDNHNLNLFEYRAEGVDYISFDLTPPGSGKLHNHVSDRNELTSYSGLLVGTKSGETDYRTAESISTLSRNPVNFISNIYGSFAVVKASEGKFECFTDNFGKHNVFYYHSPDKKVYVTNYIKLLQLIKESEINTYAFLDWLAFENIFSNETEEKDVYLLPRYGRLGWVQEKNEVQIDQYKDVSDVVYSDTPVDQLLDQVVSDFTSTAQYLIHNHNTTITLSGGYDSRLMLSMFWKFDKSTLDSYSYNDNYYDVKIARKVAKDFGLKHHTLSFSTELPSFETLHRFLADSRYPFFKYSAVFDYMVHESLQKLYDRDHHRVLLKGMGGNSDRRIFERNYMDELEGEEAIGRHIENALIGLDTNLFTEDAIEHLRTRLQKHYTERYREIISGRGKDHKLKYHLFKERYEFNFQRVSAGNDSHTVDKFLPLMMDSFQTLIFNCEEKALHRSHKNSIYHRLTNALTNAEDKPIHFSSGLHWEASKLSRAAYRLQHKVIEPRIKRLVNFRGKKTTKIKEGFQDRNVGLAKDIIDSSQNCFIWEYVDKDYINTQFSKSEKPDNKSVRYTFKHLLPILKLSSEGRI